MCADNNKKFQQPFAEKGELRSVAAERGFDFISSPTVSYPALIRPEKTLDQWFVFISSMIGILLRMTTAVLP